MKIHAVILKTSACGMTTSPSAVCYFFEDDSMKKNRKDYTLVEWHDILEKEYRDLCIKMALDPDSDIELQGKVSVAPLSEVCVELSPNSDGIYEV